MGLCALAFVPLSTLAMDFRILGPLEVREGERQLAIGSRKQRALLAILLLHAGTVVSRDKLVDALWAGDPPATASAALRVHVAELRKILESADAELTVDPGYRLDLRPGELDLARFEKLLAEATGPADARDSADVAKSLRTALAMWRGQALADFAYEAFAAQAIGRLEELRLVAHERCIDAELELGRERELVPELDELVAQHRLRERLRGQLMLALYRCGRQADALASYQDARRVMADELGIEPGQPLQALEQQILNHDPVLNLHAPPAVDALSMPGTSQASPQEESKGASDGQVADAPVETPDRPVLLFGQRGREPRCAGGSWRGTRQAAASRAHSCSRRESG